MKFRDRRNALRRARPLSLLGTQNANSVKVWASLHFWSGLDCVSRSRAVRSPKHFAALGASGRRSMLLVLVHLRCVGAIFTGGRHHPRARPCAGLGHHCALAATVPNDPAFIDGVLARHSLWQWHRRVWSCLVNVRAVLVVSAYVVIAQALATLTKAVGPHTSAQRGP